MQSVGARSAPCVFAAASSVRPRGVLPLALQHLWILLLKDVGGRLALEPSVLLPVPHPEVVASAAKAVQVDVLADVEQHPQRAHAGGRHCLPRPKGALYPGVKIWVERVHLLLQHVRQLRGLHRSVVARWAEHHPFDFHRAAKAANHGVLVALAEAAVALVLVAEAGPAADVGLEALDGRVVAARHQVVGVDLGAPPLADNHGTVAHQRAVVVWCVALAAERQRRQRLEHLLRDSWVRRRGALVVQPVLGGHLIHGDAVAVLEGAPKTGDVHGVAALRAAVGGGAVPRMGG
mmetsp:Transcript_35974/g.90733  ORF Transcript_35974/g.90733 Transcript_35974/m.90733 type:complete len:291 (+) Transcript_35974:275-1147(+)